MQEVYHQQLYRGRSYTGCASFGMTNARSRTWSTLEILMRGQTSVGTHAGSSGRHAP